MMIDRHFGYTVNMRTVVSYSVTTQVLKSVLCGALLASAIKLYKTA